MFFVVVAGHFHWRIKAVPTAAAQDPTIRWESYLCSIYLVGILVMIRSLFRAAEFVGGNKGYLMTTEVFFYIFDSVPMLFAVVWLHWKHPGEVGVRLRGEIPCTNGFHLIKFKSPPGF